MPTTFMWSIQIKDCRKIFLLLIAYIVYLVFGAFVFQYFEEPFEHSMRLNVGNITENVEKKLLNGNISVSEFKEILHKYLLARDINLVDQFGVLTNQNWNFHNSFFFCTTVITTIGYGHFLPSTTAGKMFCLFYALFGIPMTGILLGAIGQLFSRCFMIRIKQIKERYKNRNGLNAAIVWRYLETAVLFFIPWFIVFLIIPSLIFVVIERWSFLESFYYSFITLTTIGFGDYVAGNYDGQTWIVIYKLLVVLWIIFGLSYLSMTLNFIGRGYKKVEHSEMIHSSIAHLSEPFLHRKPKISVEFMEESDNESIQIAAVAVKNQLTASDLNICSQLREHHKHHSNHNHHNHHNKTNDSVLPYII